MKHLRRGFIGIGIVLALVGCLFEVPFQPPLGSVTGKTGSGQVSESRKGPIFGQVLELDGKPAAAVKVLAHLNGANPLVGNAGAGLVGNSGGALAGNSAGAYRFQSVVETVTDQNGQFSVDVRNAGSYNLEAVKTEAVKGWRSAVKWDGAGTQADAGKVKLAPTGHITGRVRAQQPNVTDLSNTTVYVPGSSYIAITKPDGSYTISNVPAGDFDLGAFHADLGDARLPDQDYPGQVRVTSSETTTAPNLVLKFNPPELSGVYRTDSGESTDNAAPGTAIEIKGKYFGFNRGAKATMEFTKATQFVPERLSDELIRVPVPSDAANGKIVVIIGGRPSSDLAFRVMREFTLGIATLSLPVDATADLSSFIAAVDSDGIRIVEDNLGTPRKARPNISWAVDSNRASVSAQGIVRGLSEGAIVISAKAGSLPQRAISVTVVSRASAPDNASPTPPGASSPTPAPSPTSSQTPGPTIQPTVGPTTTPSPTPFATATPAGGAGVLSPFAVVDGVTVTVPRWQAAYPRVGDSIYVLGGVTAGAATDSVERSQISAIGSISSFGSFPGSKLSTPRHSFSTFRAGNWLYAVGGQGQGGSVYSLVERAAIGENDSLSTFTKVDGLSLSGPRCAHASVVVGSKVYLLGGYRSGNIQDIEAASISQDGSVSSFSKVSSVLVSPVLGHSAAVIGKYVYVFGGEFPRTRTVQRAPILANDDLGSFSKVQDLVQPREYLSNVLIGSFMYVLGGVGDSYRPLASVESAVVDQEGNLSQFSTISNSLAVNRQGFGVQLIGNSLYVFGGYDEEPRGTSVPVFPVERAVVN